MGILHGLVVVFVIFGGIITPCESVGNRSRAEIERLFKLLSFESVRDIIRSHQRTATDMTMRNLLKSRVVQFKKSYDDPNELRGGVREVRVGAEIFVTFESYWYLKNFFEKFNNDVIKIEIDANDVKGWSRNSHSTHNFVKLAKNLEELRIKDDDSGEFWEQLSNGKDEISFPKVKKFQYSGNCNQNEFKLNLIFPKLGSVKLNGTIKDTNCLAEINTLEELELITTSIKEDQLVSIFAINQNLENITVSEPMEPATMEAIAKYLTKLRSLCVIHPGRNFLMQTDNRQLCNISSVINLSISLNNVNDFDGNLSFDMPKLENLKLVGTGLDTPIITFIKHFKELKSVELISMKDREMIIGRGMNHFKKEFEDSTWIVSYEKDEIWAEVLMFVRQLNA